MVLASSGKPQGRPQETAHGRASEGVRQGGRARGPGRTASPSGPQQRHVPVSQSCAPCTHHAAADGIGSRGAYALALEKDPLAARQLPYWDALRHAAEADGAGAAPCGNSRALLEEHARANGDAVRTRFPPEPNGYLHMGHAQSMNMNFALAFAKLEEAGIAIPKKETVFRCAAPRP